MFQYRDVQLTCAYLLVPIYSYLLTLITETYASGRKQLQQKHILLSNHDKILMVCCFSDP